MSQGTKLLSQKPAIVSCSIIYSPAPKKSHFIPLIRQGHRRNEKEKHWIRKFRKSFVTIQNVVKQKNGSISIFITFRNFSPKWYTSVYSTMYYEVINSIKQEQIHSSTTPVVLQLLLQILMIHQKCKACYWSVRQRVRVQNLLTIR